ncbi:MAG: GTPase Era [Bacteroidia bacterium]|nr:GTPase Era [Bacteroidia bacterium]
MESVHKSGFVAIIGKPNAGKSTLLNALMGKKMVIATHKPQTTRHRILGILSTDDFQVVFSDTPGVIKPSSGLQKAMMRFVDQSFEDADLILLLIDVNEKFPEDILMEMMGNSVIPIILVINKIDEASEEKIAQREAEIKDHVEVVDTIHISALRKRNLTELMGKILDNLDEGPAWFPKDSLSDRPERFFVTEIVREKIFLNLSEELPYSTQVVVQEFKEEEDIIRIVADIHVDRKSQKGMVIGKGGSMIKKIGSEARYDLEEFFAKRVFLELYVRVTEGWRESNFRLKDFGYME